MGTRSAGFGARDVGATTSADEAARLAVTTIPRFHGRLSSRAFAGVAASSRALFIPRTACAKRPRTISTRSPAPRFSCTRTVHISAYPRVTETGKSLSEAEGGGGVGDVARKNLR